MTAILAIGFLVLCAVCALKESKVTGLYKTFGVYGRLAAYFGLFCPMGLGMFIASFFAEEFSLAASLGFLALAVLGGLIYFNAYRKCPAFLRRRCIPSMLLSGLGVCIKICVFFLGFVWRLTGPQEMTDSSGNVVYLYSGEVYDSAGNHIGTASADRQSYRKNR